MSAAQGFFVGGEPMALLAASSALYEVAARTDDVGRHLATALAPAATTVLAAAPYAPTRAAAVLAALNGVTVGPGRGLASVAAAFAGASQQLRFAGQALEAAGAVGLLARGGLGLLRGQRPTVLASADGVDLRRESFTGSWSTGPVGGSSTLGVRQVERADGTSFYVVEATLSVKHAESAGIQVNGVGLFGEATHGPETTVRWAVPTRRDAELLLAAVSAAMVPVAGGAVSLPKPTETVLGRTLIGSFVAPPGPVPGVASASGTATGRVEVRSSRSGQRFAASVSGAGQLGLTGVAGTGAAGSARVAVDRNPAGAITRVSVATTTEVDRGRHGNSLVEAGNREASLVEREWEVELTPERRAAADRVATAVARGDAPDRADLEVLAGAANDARFTERTYDTRHQQASVDVSLKTVDVGGGGALDTAVRRDP